MKAISIIFASCLLAGFTYGQNIPSANAAGYIKISGTAGQFLFVQQPFNKFDGTDPKVSEIMGDSVAAGTKVFTWNDATQSYSITTYIPALPEPLRWNPSDPTLKRGQGFFIQLVADTDVFLHGEVPGATTDAQTNYVLLEGFNAVGFPYPTEISVEDALTDHTVPGDKVFLWNQTTQSYSITTRTAIPILPWNPAGVMIKPGQGLFLQTGPGGGSYTAEVPYTWPNN